MNYPIQLGEALDSKDNHRQFRQQTSALLLRDKGRRTVYLGRVSGKEAESIRRRIEGILPSTITFTTPAALAKSSSVTSR